MNVRGERIIIFGDSLSHHGGSSAPEIWDVNASSARQSSAPGDLLGSFLLEQGAEAVRINARVSRSAWNFWQRENASALLASDRAFRPTKVIVILGTNDADSGVALDKDQAAFTEIRDQYQDMGAEVYAIGPFLSAIDAGRIENTVGVMKRVFGMRFIDGRPLSQLAVHSGDGVHYSTTGARTLALAMTDAIISKMSPTSIWNTVGLGVLGIGIVFLGAMTFKRFRPQLSESFTTASDGAMLGELEGTVDIVNGKRHRGTTNELIRKGYSQIPCSSKLDESGLARCWAKKAIDVKGVELAGNDRDEAIAYAVKDSAARAPKFGRKVMISDVYEQLVEDGRDDGMSIDEFKEELVRLHKNGAIVLSRADLVAALDSKKVAKSETDARGATYHFVNLSGAALAAPEDQRYMVRYRFVTRDGTVGKIVEHTYGRPLTLAEADKLRKAAKRKGYDTPWIETVDGEFVPVEGAKRNPKLPPAKGDELHWTQTSSPPKDKPRRADDYVEGSQQAIVEQTQAAVDDAQRQADEYDAQTARIQAKRKAKA